jgi:hypothetical protein
MSHHFLSLPATGTNFHWLTDSIAHRPRQRALSDKSICCRQRTAQGRYVLDQPALGVPHSLRRRNAVADRGRLPKGLHPGGR